MGVGKTTENWVAQKNRQVRIAKARTLLMSLSWTQWSTMRITATNRSILNNPSGEIMKIESRAGKNGLVGTCRGQVLTASLNFLAVATLFGSVAVGGLSTSDLNPGKLISTMRTVMHDEEQQWKPAEVFEGKRVWIRQF